MRSSRRTGFHGLRAGLGVTVCAFVGSSVWLSVLLFAQDLRNLKPLPKFLRNAKLAERYLGTRDIDEIMRFERVEAVCLQLVKRPAVPPHVRREALQELAKLRSSDAVAELLPWIVHWDQVDAEALRKGDALEDLAPMLPAQEASLLHKHRDELVALLSTGARPASRQAAMIAVVQADQSPNAAWDLATTDTQRLSEFINGLAWLPNDAPRQQLFGKIRPLLDRDDAPALQRAAVRQIGALDIQPRETFEQLADMVASGRHPAECVESICKISSEHWTGVRRLPLARGLLDYLQQLPLADRTNRDAKQTIKLVGNLAERLPSEHAEQVIRRLSSMRIHEITVATLKEQMTYDRTVLVVQASQGIQLTLRNDDIMPHNLVIVRSAEARESVGIAADRMQNEAGALAKGYLPDSDDVLHATKMIQPSRSDVLTFTAPQQTGTYAYVCTFPGHWSKMYGALVVVDDVQQYLADNQPLPSADDLLGIQTVQWDYEQLLESLSDFATNRSFENGQKNFLKASCFSCHQVQQQGGRIGPDLTKVNEQHKTPAELLKHIMKPSDKVEEKYATVIIETDDGRILRGVVIDETDTEIRFTENPLDGCAVTTIPKDSIEDLTRSKLSPMPAGLLNTLVTPADVMDLLAYLASAGSPDHPLYATQK